MPENPGATAVAEPTAPAAPAEDKIAFYGTEDAEPDAIPAEEPTDAAPVEEPVAEVSTAGTAVAPTEEAPAAPAVPAKAAAPASPPLPTREEVDGLARAFQQQQAQLLQYQQAIEAQAQAEAQRQLRVALEGQGYAPDQVQDALNRHADLETSKKQVAQERAAIGQYIQQQRAEDNAKIQVAQHISQKYGMPFADLMKMDNPHIMEAKAEAWQAKQELMKAQQAKVKPSKVASVGAGQQPSTSRARLLDLYNRGEKLTSEQEQGLFGSR